MLIRALLIVAFCLVSVVQLATVQAADVVGLHLFIEASAIATQSFGEKHPKVVELNREIDRRLQLGERVDATAVEARLVDLVRERGEIRRLMGARHPKTIDNARRIQAVVGMLVSAE